MLVRRRIRNKKEEDPTRQEMEVGRKGASGGDGGQPRLQ